MLVWEHCFLLWKYTVDMQLSYVTVSRYLFSQKLLNRVDILLIFINLRI